MKKLSMLAALLAAICVHAETSTITTKGPATIIVQSSSPVTKTTVAPKKAHRPKKVVAEKLTFAPVPPPPTPAPQIIYLPAPTPLHAEAAVDKPHEWSVGAAVGELSQNGGVGIQGGSTAGLIGTYQLSPHWYLRGDLDFSNFQLSDSSSVTTTTSTQVPSGPIKCHTNPWTLKTICTQGSKTVTSANTVLGDANSSYNQTDVSFSPTYRLLTSALSPVFGLGLDYSHSYYNTTYSGSAAGSTGGNSDAFSAVGLVGLDYKVSNSVSVGVDFRYFQPVGFSTDNPSYYPAGNQTPSSVPYSTGTANLQIHF